MIRRASKIATMGAVVLGVVSLGGCATKKYVNEQLAPLSSHVSDQDTKMDAIDKTAQDALQRAEAAGKLAEGKFVYSMVLSDDSMKFDAGSATLSPEAQSRLDAFVEKLKSDNRNVYVEIQGYTDARGSEAANEQLGAKRAEAVRRYLNEHGVALNRMSTISYGSENPIAPNDTAEGRAANRRVVLIVLA
ncbi:OmpA family protein [Phenylobacterium sp.]|uniref:OmpA family protein n=1 Tax=Phenylobacterium sp. TaxID=1871053 RepID=UPI0035B0169D